MGGILVLCEYGVMWYGVSCHWYLYAGTKGERWWGIMDMKDGGCEGRGQGAGPALGVICGGEVRGGEGDGGGGYHDRRRATPPFGAAPAISDLEARLVACT